MRELSIRGNNYLLAVVTLFIMTGTMGTRPLVTLMSSEMGASPAKIGIIVALFSILPLLFSVKIGRVVDKVGTIRPMQIAILIACVGLSVPFFYYSLIGVYVSQIMVGLSHTIFALSAQSYAGNTTLAEDREKNIIIFSLASAGAIVIGPLLGGILSDYIGYGPTFAVFGLIGFLPWFVLFMIKKDLQPHENTEGKEHKPEDHQTVGKTGVNRNNFLDLLKIPNLRKAIFVSAIILLARDLYMAYFPLLASSAGYSTTMIGIIIAVHTGGAMIIRLFAYRLIELFGKGVLISTSILFSGILYASTPFVHEAVYWVIVGFILGMFIGIGQPLSITTTIQASPKERIGEAIGLRLSVNRLTQVVAPVLFGGVSVVIGVSGIFWVVGIVLAVASLKARIKDEG